jgi:hypothetical protein
MMNELQVVLADVATGAGDSVRVLRDAGIGVDLLGYTIEVSVEPGDPSPAATVTLTLGKAPTGDR